MNNKTTLRLAWSLLLTLVLVGIEVVAGTISNSLALLTDAAHNFTDVIALGLSWYALRRSTHPAHDGKTYGYHRVGILVALINSTTLVLISFVIFYEAWFRFISPPEVDAPILIGVASLAFLVNAVTAWLVHRGSDHDLNLRSAYLHLLGDTLSTVGAVVAGVAILFTGWNWLDPLVSVLVGLLIAWNAWRILRQTINILLESAPENIDINAMVDDMLKLDGVTGVHDLHVWSISENMRMMTAHIQTDDIQISLGANLQNQINQVLLTKYKIQHATLQLECEGCDPALLYCDIRKVNHIHEHV